MAKPKTGRQNVTIKLDPELWKKVKHHCIDEEKEISTFIEELLREKLDSRRESSK